ncbi:MAG: bacillithiol biosynthesis deacetylase BshB1 [Candidatus Zixiibacteriota bacterium]|nr:MAG: bacillithiol biosynthesis deacetylase BshB1 [candidate division Zixibacteria bacterium]
MDTPNAPEPLHLMAVAAHPDDIELTCGGTLIKMARAGYRTGVLDLTRGEMGTRGTPEQRLREAREAARIMGLTVRENAGLPDGWLSTEPDLKMVLVRALRKWRPALWLVPCSEERHPDHAAVGRAALDAAFLAGLRKIDTGQPMYRPTWILQYLCRRDDDFSFIVDVSDSFEARLDAIRAYRSQFDPDSGDPQTYISRPQFLDTVIARARFYGSKIEAAYGEPFLSRETLRVDDPVAFLAGTRPDWATLR